jgi:hypothetical protein
LAASVLKNAFTSEAWLASGASARSKAVPPRVMKIPLLCYEQDPAAIVSFEVEQMIVPRLIGVHAAISTSLTWSSN